MALFSWASLSLVLLWTCISCTSGQPVTNHSANLCVWKGQCGPNPEHEGGILNCFYNGPPVVATKGGSDGLFELIEANCPWYIDQTTNNTAAVCCDSAQVQTLQTQVKLAQELLSRCPACYKNFMRHFCATTCDPNQALFMDPTTFTPSPSNASVYAVEGVMTYVTTNYASNLYNSCKDVEFSQQSGKVISLLCGTTHCNPPTWLTFMGDPNQNPLTPFLIGYTFVDDPTNTSGLPVGMEPFDVPLYRCNDSDPNIQCTCADCITACPPLPPIPNYVSRLWVFGVGMAAAGVFLTLVFFLAALIGMCVTLATRRPGEEGTERDVDAEDDEKKILDDNSVQSPPTGDIRKGCCACTVGARFENTIKWVFYRWGVFASQYWYLVCLVCLLVCGGLCFGMFFFTVTTDPVQLWSAPDSRARLEKDYYDQHFNPFYRTEQIIITTKNMSNYSVDFYTGETQDLIFTMGPVFQMEVLQEVLNLQLKIQNMTVNYTDPSGGIRLITLKDVCFAPIENTYNNNCTIQSVLNYFQNSMDNLNLQQDDPSGFYVVGNASSHIHNCVRNPSSPLDNTTNGIPIPCLGGYGGPVNPDVILGGFTSFDDEGNPDYDSATALLVTFLLNNHLEDVDNNMAMAWEQGFLDIVRSYDSSFINISYSTERSITDELNRESDTDIMTVAISYVLMFIYITIFLGHIRSIYTVFVDTKLVVGLFGVLLVLVAVVASLGVYSYMGVTATLIVLEVVPFLVLAVGVDNLFILVHSYERQHAKAPSESTVELVGRAVGDVAPSLILTSLSETSAFMLGATSSMPAVRSFSLFAGTAVFFNFLLQISAFVCLMYLDAERQKQNRVDVLCCVKMDKKMDTSCDIGPVKCDTGVLKLIMKYYSKFLLSPVVRPFVILFFGLLLSGSLGMITEIEVGLDQTVALPKDSYLMSYFYCLNKYLHTGAPVYFVVKDGFDYTTLENQNKMCAVSGCNKDSLGTQITLASRQADYTRIAQPPSSWMDTYLQWIPPKGHCCGYINNTFDQCYQPGGSCMNCISGDRPSPEEFTKYLRWFLLENPGLQCATGGHAAFNSSVIFAQDGKTLLASNVMTYHTILTTSSEYISALSHARELADNISIAMGQDVFPYSVFYVYYEQYLTIFGDFFQNIGLSLAAVYFMTIILMGFNIWAATIILGVVMLVIVNMLGYFWLLQINANAVSLVNLVMTVGIAVEFCAHIVRWYCSCPLETRLERARSALEEMGSSVVSGITITKFLGVFVLLFAKSQIFEIYYFRMYMMMLLFGFLHGLVFLPVLLSYVGPPRSTILPPPWESDSRVSSGSVNGSVVWVGAGTDNVARNGPSEKTPLLK